MYLKLPLELRNEVYGHLCIEDRPILIEPYYHSRNYVPSGSTTTKTPLALQLHFDELDIDDEASEPDNTSLLPDGRIKYDHADKPPPGMVLPNSHFFNWRYVGRALALESQEFYYGRNTFSICDVEDALRNFLTPGRGRLWPPGVVTDSWRPLEPIKFVRNLQIRIKYDQFASGLSSTMPHYGPAQVCAYEYSYLLFLQTSLRILRQLPHQTRKLKIEFVLMTDLDDDLDEESKRFTNLLETVRSTVYELVYSDQDTEITVTHVDEYISIWPRDITGLWSMTKEQWETVRTSTFPSDVYPRQCLKVIHMVVLSRYTNIRQECEANISSRLPGASGTSDCYVANDELSVPSFRRRIPSSELPDLLRQRWGIEDVLKDTKPRWPIQEGRYWPVGNVWREPNI